jgi:hypothetical protein
MKNGAGADGGSEKKLKNCNLFAIRKMEDIDFGVVTRFSNRGFAIRKWLVSGFDSSPAPVFFEHTSGVEAVPAATLPSDP